MKYLYSIEDRTNCPMQLEEEVDENVETSDQVEVTQNRCVPVTSHKWLIGWTDDEIRKFIGLVRIRKYLWDKNQTGYYNRIKRQLAYKKIGAEMGVKNTAVATKIHALRTQSMKQYKIFKNDPQKKWKFFDDVKFLVGIEDSSNDSDCKDELNDEDYKSDDSVSAAVAEAKERRYANQLFWTNKKIKRLIKLIHQNDCLWLQSATRTFNTTVAPPVDFKKIAAVMRTSVTQIKRKYSSLRCYYGRELKRAQMRKGYKTQWAFFDDMKLLCEFREKMKDPLFNSKSNVANIRFGTCVIEDDNSSTRYSSQSEFNVHEEESIELIIGHNTSDKVVLDEITGDIISEDVNHDCSMDEQLIDCSLSTSYIEKCSDRHIVFGKIVAHELRLLESYQSIQRQLKCKILEAVVEANKAVKVFEENK